MGRAKPNIPRLLAQTDGHNSVTKSTEEASPKELVSSVLGEMLFSLDPLLERARWNED